MKKGPKQRAESSTEESNAPPTDKQLAFAEHLEIEIPEGATKWDLSDLINEALAVRSERTARPPYVSTLVIHGDGRIEKREGTPLSKASGLSAALKGHDRVIRLIRSRETQAPGLPEAWTRQEPGEELPQLWTERPATEQPLTIALRVRRKWAGLSLKAKIVVSLIVVYSLIAIAMSIRPS